MDRMLEVNKVASLMRRCENPKPLALPSELGSSGAFQRGFLQPALEEWCGGGRGPGGRQLSLRLSLAGSAFAFQAMESPGEPGGRLATGPRALATPAQQGRPLRVSISSGFRIPKPILPGSPAGVSLYSPALKRPLVKSWPGSPVAPASGPPRISVVDPPRPKIRFARVSSPVLPAGGRDSGSRWLDFIPAPARYPAATRLATVPFSAPAEAPPAPGPVGSKES
jgi:hypothetical protein